MSSPVDSATRGCELCGATATRHRYVTADRLGLSDDALSIVECVGCGVWRTLPEISDDDLARFYPDTYWGDAGPPSDQWVMASQREKTRFVKKCGLAGGRVLDVGCGSGLFLRALDGEHWNRFGIEIGAVAAETARSAVAGGGEVFCGTLLDARDSGWLSDLDSGFDLVTLWSALEHMNNPRENLHEARRRLKAGGTLIVQVPNAASYQARWFGGRWFALDAPRHRYHFNPARLRQLLMDAGFEPYRLTLFSTSHNAHALRQSLKSTLFNSGLGPRAARALFVLSIPFQRPLDYAMTAIGSGATITVASRAA